MTWKALQFVTSKRECKGILVREKIVEFAKKPQRLINAIGSLNQSLKIRRG